MAVQSPVEIGLVIGGSCREVGQFLKCVRVTGVSMCWVKVMLDRS